MAWDRRMPGGCWPSVYLNWWAAGSLGNLVSKSKVERLRRILSIDLWLPHARVRVYMHRQMHRYTPQTCQKNLSYTMNDGGACLRFLLRFCRWWFLNVWEYVLGSFASLLSEEMPWALCLSQLPVDTEKHCVANIISIWELTALVAL